MDPEVSAEELDEIFPRTCFGVLLLTLVRGLVLVYASLLNGLHSSGAPFLLRGGSSLFVDADYDSGATLKRSASKRKVR